MSKITLPIYINDSKLVTFYWTVKYVLYDTVFFCCLSEHCSKSLTERDLCTPNNGRYAWMAFPNSGFPLSTFITEWSGSAPAALRSAVCFDTLGLFINGVAHFLRSLFRCQAFKTTFLETFSSLAEENSQSRLFTPPPTTTSSRLSSGSFFFIEQARYITTIVFPWFVPPETTQQAFPVFARFSSFSKEKLHRLWKVFWVGSHQTDAVAEQAFAASKHSHSAFTHCSPHMIICPLLVITHHDDWWNVCEAGLASSLGLTPRTCRNCPIIKHGSVWRQPKGGLTCQWLIFVLPHQDLKADSRHHAMLRPRMWPPDRYCSINRCCFIWSVSLFVLDSC